MLSSLSTPLGCRKKDSSTRASQPTPTNTSENLFHSTVDRVYGRLLAAGWLKSEIDEAVILANGNLKVAVKKTGWNAHLIVSYHLTDRTPGHLLGDQMTDWALLAGSVDIKMMDWLVDDCIPTLWKPQEREIDGLDCTYYVSKDTGGVWCILFVTYKDASAPGAIQSVRGDPSYATRVEVRNRVSASMRQSGYFRYSK